MEKIQAKQLATGDKIYFPRIGARTVKRLAAVYEIGISVVCDDGQMRTLDAGKELKVELSNSAPVAGIDEIYRLDRATGRTSIVSVGAFHRGFCDIRENFSALRGRVQEGSTTAALTELRAGAMLFTDKAQYWLAGETSASLG
jgi:hypothetical protein